jgi:hypothetical protein
MLITTLALLPSYPAASDHCVLTLLYAFSITFTAGTTT